MICNRFQLSSWRPHVSPYPPQGASLTTVPGTLLEPASRSLGRTCWKAMREDWNHVTPQTHLKPENSPSSDLFLPVSSRYFGSFYWLGTGGGRRWGHNWLSAGLRVCHWRCVRQRSPRRCGSAHARRSPPPVPGEATQRGCQIKWTNWLWLQGGALSLCRVGKVPCLRSNRNFRLVNVSDIYSDWWWCTGWTGCEPRRNRFPCDETRVQSSLPSW